MALSALREVLSRWGRWLVNQYNIRITSFGSYPNNVQVRRYIHWLTCAWQISNQVWPTTLQEWRDQNKIVDQHGDCKMFCHGWLSMEGAFREQGVSLYYPVYADPGEDFWLREPPEGVHPKASSYAYGSYDRRRVQQRVSLSSQICISLYKSRYLPPF